MDNPSIDTIMSLNGNSVSLIINSIAERVRQRRLELNLTQRELASRSGIPLPTYRKFETMGEMSLRRLVMIGWVMDMADEFSTLFATKTYQSMMIYYRSKKQKTAEERGKMNKIESILCQIK